MVRFPFFPKESKGDTSRASLVGLVVSWAKALWSPRLWHSSSHKEKSFEDIQTKYYTIATRQLLKHMFVSPTNTTGLVYMMSTWNMWEECTNCTLRRCFASNTRSLCMELWNWQGPRAIQGQTTFADCLLIFAVESLHVFDCHLASKGTDLIWGKDLDPCHRPHATKPRKISVPSHWPCPNEKSDGDSADELSKLPTTRASSSSVNAGTSKTWRFAAETEYVRVLGLAGSN